MFRWHFIYDVNNMGVCMDVKHHIQWLAGPVISNSRMGCQIDMEQNGCESIGC